MIFQRVISSCRLLPPAYCFLFSNRQLLQNFFLGFFDRHAVTLSVFVDWTILEHVVPVVAQNLDLPHWILWRRGAGLTFITHLRLAFFRSCGRFVELFSKARRALQTWFGRQTFFIAQSHR